LAAGYKRLGREETLGGGDTLPVQLEVIVVDRAADVDCEHQSHICSIGSGGCAKRHSPGDGQNRRDH
jgi:hypothetical protein